MGGKVSLILVLGFSAIFGLMGTNMLKMTNESTDNYIRYYNLTNAHNLAVSGANMAANEIFINKYWMTGYSSLNYKNGSINVSVDSFGVDNKLITSIGNYNGYQDTVIVLLEPKNFAQYGNFYNSMAAWAATGDTFSGPFHTNDYLKCYGDPVFLGYTTTKNGVKLYHKNGTDHPEFHGGLQEGIYIPLEFEEDPIRKAASDDGRIFKAGSVDEIIDVNMVLNSDGTITYKTRVYKTGDKPGIWGDTTRAALKDISPNGVIYIDKGNLFIQGTLSGRLSVVTDNKGLSNAGQIHITDDLRYNKNPLIDPTSTDMLGLIAKNFVQVDFNPATGDRDLHASIYSQKDGLIIEDYAKYPTAYNMNIIGGVIGEKVRATAKYKWDGKQYVPTNGYSYVHKFDERFNKTVPPFFPKTKYYKVVTWLE